MKMLPPKPYSRLRREARPHSRYIVALCLILAGLVLAASAIKGSQNHPPFVGWLADQAVYGPGFATQYIRIEDYDGNPFTITKVSSNENFYHAVNVHVDLCTMQPDFDAGCPNDGHGYKVSFSPNPDPMSPPPHVATITLKAKENGAGGLTGSTSFTLRLNDPLVNINPPTIQNLPNRALPIGAGNVASYKTEFVVGDLNEDGMEDVCLDESQGATCASTLTASATSDNHTLLLDYPDGIQIDLMSPDADLLAQELPRHYLLTATTLPGQTGTATVTVNLTDKDNNVTSTSFVLRVFPSSDAEPSISNTSLSYEEQVLPATSLTHQFTVASNDSTLKQDLFVTAWSSNTKLVPNDFVNNIQVTQPISTGAGSV